MEQVGQNRNFSKELERLIAGLDHRTPGLLLHACCAPCSSSVLEYLTQYFTIFLLFYNPNIAPEAEYEKRRQELERLIAEMPQKHPVALLPCEYRGADFQRAARGMENEPEGGARCMACYRLRMEEAAYTAQNLGLEYFTTTLSLSPLKNARAINQIGEELARKYKVKHLPSDFKKRDGYKRSIQLSQEYGLYRQDYCGCVYSKAEREWKKSQGERTD